MYNRYIPQPDGSYRKNRIPDPEPASQIHREQPKQLDDPKPAPSPAKETPCAQPQIQNHHPQRHSDASEFFRRLLPKEIDTGDLLIIILLLLMAGDSKEDNNTALLTLALYFFL